MKQEDFKSDPKKAWRKYAVEESDDDLPATLANTIAAIRAAPELKARLAYDEMERAPVLLKPLPTVRGENPATTGEFPRALADADVTQIQEWLQHRHLPQLSSATAHQAVDKAAREMSFHPIKDYLRGLTWDGVERLDSWLETYAGANATTMFVEPRFEPPEWEEGERERAERSRENGLRFTQEETKLKTQEQWDRAVQEAKSKQKKYLAKIGRMFLISMVARVEQPGCKVDYTLVLHGPQGALKSALLRILAGEKYFDDSLPSINHKDASQHLRGKWLVEMSELGAVRRSDIEEMKAYLTRQVEKYRPSYGRLEVVEPRQCVFAGSTNQEEFLFDETGNRRFWPAPVTKCDAKALERDRDQLFAEAYAAYLAGEQWWPTPEFEAEFIQPQQEACAEEDA
jgi:predicted P-loop ATPase